MSDRVRRSRPPLRRSGSSKNPAQELRKAFLEQTWQQYASARQAFFRDVTIAAVISLLLLVTFFRSVDLFERIAKTRAHQDLIRTDQRDIDTAYINLIAQMQQVFLDGDTQIIAAADTASCLVSARLNHVGQAIATLRQAGAVATPGPPPAASPSAAGTTAALCPGTPPEATQFLLEDPTAGLTSEQIGLLTSSPPVEAARLSPVLEEILVEPINAALRQTKDDVLEQPVTDVAANLLVLVDRQIETVRASGSGGAIAADLGEFTVSVRQMEGSLDDVDLTVMTPVDQGVVDLTALLVDPATVERMVQAIENDRNAIRTTIAQMQVRIAVLDDLMGQAANARTGPTDSDLDQLQEEIDAIRDSYGKPLPGAVILEPLDAARFYPVILAVVFAFFVWRFLQLEQRRTELAAAAETWHLVPADVALFLPGHRQPGAAAGSARPATTPRFVGPGAATVLAVVPGMLVLITVLLVVRSASLSRDATWLYAFYVAAALVLFGAYWLLVRSILTGQELRMRDLPGRALGRMAPQRDDRRVSPAGTPMPSRPLQHLGHWLRVVTLVLSVSVASIGVVNAINDGIRGFTVQLDRATVIGAEITDLRITDPTISKQTYLAAHPVPRSSFPVLQRPNGLPLEDDPIGLTLTVEVTTQGLEDQSLELRWTLYDAATISPLSDPRLINQPGYPISGITPTNSLFTAAIELWIPRPTDPLAFFVGVDLVSSRGIVLDSFPSSPISPGGQTATPTA